MKEKNENEINMKENQNIKIIIDKTKKNNIPQDSEYQSEKKSENKKKDKYNLLEINTEYDEIIYFNNYCSVFRKIEFENPINQNSFPYLISREFVYSYFEDKRIIKSTSQETKNQIIGRIKKNSLNFF